MNETGWVRSIEDILVERLRSVSPELIVGRGTKLIYANEIRAYKSTKPARSKSVSYETDLLISERLGGGEWIPRIVIEAKLSRITTHDAITYSQKAATHKTVHPYLRYGILIGNRRHYPLPGRLFRHGAYFDFMLSWSAHNPVDNELPDLLELIELEVQASRCLEEIIFKSRSPKREKYTFLHRPLRLK